VSVAVYGDSITQFSSTATSADIVAGTLRSAGYSPHVHGYTSCGYLTFKGDNPWCEVPSWASVISANKADKPQYVVVELGLDDVYIPLATLRRDISGGVRALIGAFGASVRIGLVLPAVQPELQSVFGPPVDIVRRALVDAATASGGRVQAFDLAKAFAPHWAEYGATDHIHLTDVGKAAYAAFVRGAIDSLRKSRR
jgi:hypothetical protein